MPYHIPKDGWLQALEGTWVLVESVVVQASNECEGVTRFTVAVLREIVVITDANIMHGRELQAFPLFCDGQTQCSWKIYSIGRGLDLKLGSMDCTNQTVAT